MGCSSGHAANASAWSKDDGATRVTQEIGRAGAQLAVLQATTVLATALSLNRHDAMALIAETALMPRISRAERPETILIRGPGQVVHCLPGGCDLGHHSVAVVGQRLASAVLAAVLAAVQS